MTQLSRNPELGRSASEVERGRAPGASLAALRLRIRHVLTALTGWVVMLKLMWAESAESKLLVLSVLAMTSIMVAMVYILVAVTAIGLYTMVLGAQP